MSEQQTPKKSNLRVALVPISLALVFALGYVAKQVFFGSMR
jgi:hypothetical protein